MLPLVFHSRVVLENIPERSEAVESVDDGLANALAGSRQVAKWLTRVSQQSSEGVCCRLGQRP